MRGEGRRDQGIVGQKHVLVGCNAEGMSFLKEMKESF